MNKKITCDMRLFPTVFAVGRVYKIFLSFNCEVITSVKVGDRLYRNSVNGVMCSKVPVHQIEVPMSELDKFGEYTVIYRKVKQRDYYGIKTEDEISCSFRFYPVRQNKINIYHIADTHRLRECARKTGEYFGKELDLLILNGDVFEGEREDYFSLLELTSHITKGAKTVVSSRGNHDIRGALAEKYAEYNPTYLGKTYYTFTLGSIWGLVLDCGEDKEDTFEGYAGTADYSSFRLEETQFLREVVAKGEYDAPEIKHKLVICHSPFPHEESWGIVDEQRYKEWNELVYTKIKPELVLCGHVHHNKVYQSGEKYDYYGYQSCPLVVGSMPHFNGEMINETFDGCAVVLSSDKPEIFFTNEKHEIVEY